MAERVSTHDRRSCQQDLEIVANLISEGRFQRSLSLLTAGDQHRQRA